MREVIQRPELMSGFFQQRANVRIASSLGVIHERQKEAIIDGPPLFVRRTSQVKGVCKLIGASAQRLRLR